MRTSAPAKPTAARTRKRVHWPRVGAVALTAGLWAAIFAALNAF